MKQFVDLLHHRLVAEYRSEEFSRTIRLITCGESTREHDDLGFLDILFVLLDGRTDIGCILVAEYTHNRLRSGCLKGFRTV